MGARNCLFITICLAAFALIGTTLLRRQRIDLQQQVGTTRIDEPELQATVDAINAELKKKIAAVLNGHHRH